MGTEHAEAIASDLYLRAGLDPDDRPGVILLARRLLGPRAVALVPALRSRARWDEQQQAILVRAGLAPSAAAYLIAHELAEWALRELRYEGPDAEALADSIAAALVCPRALFRREVRAHGRDLPLLARVFVASESVVALRFGEVTRTPLALLTEKHLHVRGEEWCWGAESRIRAAARGRIVVPGLERIALTDAPRRALLVAL